MERVVFKETAEFEVTYYDIYSGEERTETIQFDYTYESKEQEASTRWKCAICKAYEEAKLTDNGCYEDVGTLKFNGCIN